MAEPIDGDRWNQKLATGKAMASYATMTRSAG
jgi:putative aldouronate transport system substrate-binding protein